MNDLLWRHRIAQLLDPSIEAAVIVQCDLDWLRHRLLGLRNDIDRALMAAQLRRGPSLRITRVVLHNLPATASQMSDSGALLAAFDEWHYRLAAANALLSGSAPRVHRLITTSDQSVAPLADMVELLENGQWSGPQNVDLALCTIDATGATTPLTNYDVGLEGPFSDGDPSVHM
ncbi:hypothetical protein J7E96_36300 [Streptomyces sp. ISL-96]|uniref:hypothetical protein n=1 Tax=Streptomyces sp. ISL-96 TaxID=2819191 RepID=UPI001BEA7914|nr:hypothetical protein [Streptomyces sp. ISL-96]MBT2493863.1 hypothetical protein [Streptomyces sp. ISL-96]